MSARLRRARRHRPRAGGARAAPARHELLIAAGPPPELPPALADAPEPEPAEVIPFFNRRRHAALAVLAARDRARGLRRRLPGRTPRKRRRLHGRSSRSRWSRPRRRRTARSPRSRSGGRTTRATGRCSSTWRTSPKLPPRRLLHAVAHAERTRDRPVRDLRRAGRDDRDPLRRPVPARPLRRLGADPAAARAPRARPRAPQDRLSKAGMRAPLARPHAAFAYFE